ncbi:tail fiber domain-containing protein [Kluyvera cryocrescens]|uniref:tail fiber domain-containing protein n=1 Tax=Kluyvera cryocrescens TaxID=580 RepID=UPI0039F58855
MSAGTLTLTNNSAAVMGSGTVFNNDLAAGDFIVVKAGGVTYTLPVKTIESNTALTLARNYNGPAIAAGAWTAMPRDTLNRISAQIAADTAYAIRQRVLEIDNWYQLLEVNGDVTIKMADGSSYTGPSWLKLVDAMNNPTGALAKNKNLSDLEDREEAWLNVRPEGPTPLAADPVDDNHAATKGWVETFIAAVRSVLTSWSVINGDSAAPANGTTVKGGKIRSAFQVAGAEYAAAELQASVATSSTGERSVSAEIVVKDSTSGSTTSKTIKLGTVDGLNAGVISAQNEYVKIERLLAIPATTFGGGLMLGYPSTSPHAKRGMDAYPQIDTADNLCHVFFRVLNGNGDATAAFAYHESGSANAFNGQWINGSDIHIKDNVKRIREPLAAMLEMSGCTWTYKSNGKFGIGFIAQEVEKVFPDAVTENNYPQTFPDGTSVEKVKALSAGDVAAALHHESILQLMDIVKEAITTIAGVTTDEGAKAALEALAERIPPSNPS